MAVERSHLRFVARLRRVLGLSVCEQGDAVWLRGDVEDEDLALQLAAIPGARRFDVLADKQLRPLGRLVPEGYLPEGHWQPLAAWLKVELPESLPKSIPEPQLEPVRLRLLRSGDVREPALLETSLASLSRYVDSAPLWRIQRWQLALAHGDKPQQTVLVRGLPLPPLPGQVWTEDAGICVPAGYAWEPAVDAAVVGQLLSLAPQQIALLYPDGTHEVVLPEHWVRGSRSAVRQMQEARR